MNFTGVCAAAAAWESEWWGDVASHHALRTTRCMQNMLPLPAVAVCLLHDGVPRSDGTCAVLSTGSAAPSRHGARTSEAWWYSELDLNTSGMEAPLAEGGPHGADNMEQVRSLLRSEPWPREHASPQSLPMCPTAGATTAVAASMCMVGNRWVRVHLTDARGLTQTSMIRRRGCGEVATMAALTPIGSCALLVPDDVRSPHVLWQQRSAPLHKDRRMCLVDAERWLTCLPVGHRAEEATPVVMWDLCQRVTAVAACGSNSTCTAAAVAASPVADPAPESSLYLLDPRMAHVTALGNIAPSCREGLIAHHEHYLTVAVGSAVLTYDVRRLRMGQTKRPRDDAPRWCGESASRRGLVPVHSLCATRAGACDTRSSVRLDRVGYDGSAVARDGPAAAMLAIGAQIGVVDLKMTTTSADAAFRCALSCHMDEVSCYCTQLSGHPVGIDDAFRHGEATISGVSAGVDGSFASWTLPSCAHPPE